MNGHYMPGDTVLGNWKLTRLLGEGSFGRVFEAHREDFGVTYKAAIKVITIPQSDSEVKRAYAEGMDSQSVTSYFHGVVEEIVQEFVLMSQLKGNSNVVSYEDHTVIPHENRVGWDIIIRMEMLTPLLDYMQERKPDVARLGIDICKALELCQSHNIIHRDVKPENMFVSDAGDYKLGDFGIARTVEKTTGGLSKKGTYTYMAPEVYRGDPYGASVDQYSLGIVLYTLLNDNRAPFLPAYPSPITHSDRESALAKRMSGAPLIPPKNADAQLSQIVLRACAYIPGERFAGPTQLRQALEAAQAGQTVSGSSYTPPAPERPQEQSYRPSSYVENNTWTGGSTEHTRSAFEAPPQYQNQASQSPMDTKPKKKFSIGRALAIGAACAAFVLIVQAVVSKSGKEEVPSSELDSRFSITAPPLEDILITPAPVQTYTPMSTPDPASAPTAPADMYLLIPDVIAVGTNFSPMLVSSTNTLVGVDELAESSNPGVAVIDEPNSCVTGWAAGISDITLEYNGSKFTESLTVGEVDYSYGLTISTELISDNRTTKTYNLTLNSWVLPSGNWGILAYSKCDGLHSLEMGEDNGNGVFPLTVSIFEGTAEISVIVYDRDNPEHIVGLATFTIEEDF